jgi:hypothetical protein
MTTHAAIRFYGNGAVKTACGTTTNVGNKTVHLSLTDPFHVTCKRCQAAMIPSVCYGLYAREALSAGHQALAKHYATGYLASQVKAISEAEARVLAAKEEHAKAKDLLLTTLGFNPKL